MKVNTINYKRVKNLGNYQSETLEMTAEVDSNENPIEAANQLREQVNAVLFPPVQAEPGDKVTCKMVNDSTHVFNGHSAQQLVNEIQRLKS